MNIFFQNILRAVEVGEAQVLVRIIPLTLTVLIIALLYNFSIYHGLNDAQSMDNAQLARQIVRGEGFTTKFLRPHAITQLHDYAISQSLVNGGSNQLFPPDRFPQGTPRLLPDTYNAPGYPCLLAAWFYLVQPNFDQSVEDMYARHIYSGDRWIPPLNQIFMVLTALVVFTLGRQLFDNRVAWMALVSFLATDTIWQFSVTALSTSFLMFLVTAMLFCVLKIFCVGEACSQDKESSFGSAWGWAIALVLLLAAACLTRLHLLILLAPLVVLLSLIPQARPLLVVGVVMFVIGLVAPWFWHMDKISGSPLGSNAPLLLYGEDVYKENQIFCAPSLPSYERLFKDVSKKEYLGFRWHFEHAWNLLGYNPMILLFGASILHQFKRRRVQIFQWFLLGCALFLIAANNVCVDNPEALGPWNTLIVLFPAMIVIGSAFFFVLLDRLNLHLWLLNNFVVAAILLITAMPLGLSVSSTSPLFYSFPPYIPPLIKALGQFVQPDEWMTSDMPWATAWYSDHPSLWLPDSVTDFEKLHDNICPTGLLFFTPVTWAQPVSNLTTGEDKDWFPFLTGVNLPPGFPLFVNYTIPNADYSLWSNRPRWQKP